MSNRRHTSWMDGVMNYVGSDWLYRESLNMPNTSQVNYSRTEHEMSINSKRDQRLAIEIDGRAGVQTSTTSGFLATLAGLNPPAANSSLHKKGEK